MTKPLHRGSRFTRGASTVTGTHRSHHRASGAFSVGRWPWCAITPEPLFNIDERLALLREVAKPYPNVKVDSFDGLLIDFCNLVGARVIVRGLRAATDFEYELQIAHANADLMPEIDTIFLPTRTNYGFVSASLVRDIAIHGGDVSRYAPACVIEALTAKFKKPGK